MMESDMGTGMFQSSTIGEDFSCPTPEQKLGLQKAASHGDMLDMSLSSGSASSDLSPVEGSAVSSSLTPSSESESESEFYVKRRVIQELNYNDAGIQDKITKFGATEIEAMVEDSMNEKMKENMYKSLLEKVSKYERELEFANKVIMTSQEEISRLRSELAESPTVTGVSKNLRDQFEASCFDVTKLEDDGTKVLELQNTIARLEASLQDSDQSNAMLREELRRTKERLQTSENQVLECDYKMKNKIYEVTHEMQHQINSTNEVVRCLETELASRVDASANERSHFLSDISVLSKQHKAIQTRLDQAESRVKLLEDQVGQSILEKLEIRDSLEAQEKQFQAGINQLKTELAQRCEHVEAERSELLGKLEDGEGMATELRLKVAKLEKEAAMQKDVIFDRAEEKREAIRQLCFSLEYYRSEYHQLCRAFSGLKRHPLAVQ